MRSRAAERRKIHSLGREPQDTGEKKRRSRGAATEILGRRLRPTPQHRSVAPFGGFHSFAVFTLGLTPQAKNLSRLRRFSSSHSFGLAAVHPHVNRILHLASGIWHLASSFWKLWNAMMSFIPLLRYVLSEEVSDGQGP